MNWANFASGAIGVVCGVLSTWLFAHLYYRKTVKDTNQSMAAVKAAIEKHGVQQAYNDLLTGPVGSRVSAGVTRLAVPMIVAGLIQLTRKPDDAPPAA